MLDSPSPLAAPLPGPAIPLEHPAWCHAASRIRAALAAGTGRVAVVGEPGSGRSGLLAALAEGPLPVASICKADGPFGPGVVLIDDADGLDDATLQRLALVPNDLVLVGKPPFATRLMLLPFGCTMVQLPGIDRAELGSLVAARLAQHGLRRIAPNAAVLDDLASRSGLRTRPLLRLVDAAVQQARRRPPPVEHPPAAPPSAPARRTLRLVEAPPPPPPPPPGPTYGSPALSMLFAEPTPPPTTQMPPVPQRPRRRTGWLILLTLVGLAVPLARIRIETGLPPKAPRAPARDAASPSAPPAAEAPASPPGQPAADDRAPSPAPAASLPDAAPAPSPGQTPAATAKPEAAAAPLVVAHPALPAAAPLHVILTFPRGDVAAANRAGRYALALRAGGVEAADPVPGSPRPPAIEYFFAEDRPAADEVAAVLGRETPIRLGHPVTPAQPGTVEVTVGPDH